MWGALTRTCTAKRWTHQLNDGDWPVGQWQTWLSSLRLTFDLPRDKPQAALATTGSFLTFQRLCSNEVFKERYVPSRGAL